jgi:hypothetical protein
MLLTEERGARGALSVEVNPIEASSDNVVGAHLAFYSMP